MDRFDITRACFEAYATCDRELLERHLADDLWFFSPYDVGIDRAAYFERCWPNAELIESYDIIRLVESGDAVVVTYEATKSDGKRFRNTEVLTFRGDHVCRVEVYFGWDLA